MFRYARIILLAALCTVLALPLLAQDDINEEDLTRAVIQARKRVIISAVMGLTNEESAAFWPIYDSYQNVLRGLNDRQLDLITDFVESYGSINDEKAEELLKESMSIESEALKQKKAYIKRFKKVLPAKKVARYFQTENKLDAIIRVELAEGIPLVE